ncbi:MAG: flagellar protein FliS [Rhodospirillales bacterium]|nr:flagellar protein FliS [Rhodospirillales bacterium]MDE2458320.1 flagellar protein FliS [Rhodospirillales bacterium]
MNEISMDAINTTYRAAMFDGEPGLHWLRQGWRGLRHYGRRARVAIEQGDHSAKAQMISRADELLNVMSGVLGTENSTTLGPALMTIYSALRFTLLRANTENSLEALQDFDAALSFLDRDMIKISESVVSA